MTIVAILKPDASVQILYGDFESVNTYYHKNLDEAVHWLLINNFQYSGFAIDENSYWSKQNGTL